MQAHLDWSVEHKPNIPGKGKIEFDDIGTVEFEVEFIDDFNPYITS
jgi:hypothetical protein